MNYNEEEIGKRIQSERLKHNWTQKQLGEKLHLSGKQISVYEKGKIPPQNVLVEMCNLFNCELGYLLGEEGYEQETLLFSKIKELSGLTPDTLTALNKIGYIEDLRIRPEERKVKYTLNKILQSQEFSNIVTMIHNIKDISDNYKEAKKPIEEKYTSEQINEALKIINSSPDDDIKLDLNVGSEEELTKIASKIEDYGFNIDAAHRDLRIAEFDISEELLQLVRDLS